MHPLVFVVVFPLTNRWVYNFMPATCCCPTANEDFCSPNQCKLGSAVENSFELCALTLSSGKKCNNNSIPLQTANKSTRTQSVFARGVSTTNLLHLIRRRRRRRKLVLLDLFSLPCARYYLGTTNESSTYELKSIRVSFTLRYSLKMRMGWRGKNNNRLDFISLSLVLFFFCSWQKTHHQRFAADCIIFCAVLFARCAVLLSYCITISPVPEYTCVHPTHKRCSPVSNKVPFSWKYSLKNYFLRNLFCVHWPASQT